MSATDDPILVEGQTCWRVAPASRVAFLVDGAAYFQALASAIENAQRSVVVVGWDFHSRVRLRNRHLDDAGEPGADELARLLDQAASRRRGLRIHVLGWDFAMIYAGEREFLPLLRFGLGTHRRVRFRLDGNHPVGASHHQKIAVIDDALAFSGGLDLTACRWDTPEHRPDDARRCDPGFADYAPFHDVHMAVDGATAAALGELVRQRWWRATGQRLRPPRRRGNPWPGDLPVDLRDVDVGISRTDPAHDGRPQVREVEALWIRALRAARRSIYIENQYLSSARVAEVLVERLREASGPELVIVGPQSCSGWLEEASMGALRARLLRRLREADVHDRLRVYHPVVPGVAQGRMNVHSKVLVVDDRLLRIGSANLSNRSLGMDSECDLSVESRGDPRIARAILDFRHRLLAEHAGVEPKHLEEAVGSEGSLAGALARLCPPEAEAGVEARRLAPLDGQVPEWMEQLVPATALADPEKPVSFDELMRQMLPEEIPIPSGLHRFSRVAIAGGAVLVLAALWNWTPLSEMVTPERLSLLAAPLRESPAGPALAAGGIALLSVALVPVVALIVSAGLVFGGPLGFGVALLGSMLGAAGSYAIGAGLWRDAVRELAGPRLNRLSRLLARRGVLSVAAVRVVPVAPFTVVNMVAGASQIGFRDFMVGTLLGMAPGTLALCVLSESALRAIRDPAPATLLGVVLVASVAVTAMVVLRRRAERDVDADEE